MSRTILLADDSLTIQKVVELTFADTDYEVVTLSSGDDLLQQLPDVRPDLVICDIIMPGKDGYEVCQEIKSDPASLHIPVILLSGTFEPFDRDRALAAGCSEIITKPFEARKLVDTVERLLTGGATESAPPTTEGAVEPPSVESIAPAPDLEPETVEAVTPAPEFEPETVEAVAPTPDFEPETVEAVAPTPDFGPETVEAVAPAPEAEPEPAEPVVPAEQIEPESIPPADEEPMAAAAEPEVPPEPETTAEEPEAERGLDFTDTGFAEMEAAGRDLEGAGGRLPDEGLDFEFSDEVEAFGQPTEEEEPERSDTEPDLDLAGEVEAAAVPTVVEPEPDTEPEVSAEPVGPPEDAVRAEPFPEPPGEDEAATAVPDIRDPFAPEDEDEEPPEGVALETPTETPYTETAGMAESVSTSPGDLQIPEMEPQVDVGDFEPEPSEAFVGEEPPMESADTPDDDADTTPVPSDAPEPAEDVELEPDVAPSIDLMPSVLSEDDVDRIARRVLELATERIEHIAWEVVPDMAEIVVRQRIRELESEAENPPGDTAH
jgi:CheY-like chemotaxis protein